MSVEVPEMEELLRPMPVARYGDDADGTVRGGALHLSALLPALSSAIGCPTPTAVHRDPTALQRAFGLPDVSSAVVVLVDGLGYWNLAMRLGHAPYLRSLMNDAANQRPICTCAPSTTVAAMGVFGTGTCPGLTGMAGYTQRNPVTGQLAQLIQFRDSIAPHDLQRQPTVFELLTERGVRVTSSGLPKFAASPLTEAALRGTQYISNVMPRDRVLAAAQAGLREGNERLTRLNGEMQKAMRELDLSNRRLTATGERLNAAVAGLDESNRVKEKYIGLFLRQCSSYIERMDHMRRDVLAMVKAKRYGELYDMVKKHGFRDKEQEELFEIFDSTFIRLFPTFVDEFNQLLRPECRIALADQSKLNTGVRIFALIRLGIDDSSKIAEFLHYSVNTIYNYRARIKNGAMVSRDEFEDMVRSIGLPRRVAKGCSDTQVGGPDEE